MKEVLDLQQHNRLDQMFCDQSPAGSRLTPGLPIHMMLGCARLYQNKACISYTNKHQYKIGWE